MEPLTTPAIVLAVREYGESDKIVTFYSRKRGRISGIAKGARRSLKRFVNKLELFTLLEIIYNLSRSSSLVMVNQADLIHSFPSLRTNYNRYVAAALVCELTLQWTRENDPDPRFFDLILWTLLYLSEDCHSPQTAVIIFQIRLLTLMGFSPDLEHCTVCGEKVQHQGPCTFLNSRNGFLCGKCSSRGMSDGNKQTGISIGTIKILQKAKDLPRSKLARLHFSRDSTRESLLLLNNYMKNILQREIRSWTFIKNLPQGSRDPIVKQQRPG